jgi:hypothetical protein
MPILKTEIAGSDLEWKTVSQIVYNLFLAHSIVDKIGNDPSCGLFSIFDGHGGR